ncbi:MAG: hypothetical protein LBU32_24355 [Clostridiales bacterium]|nr:hypothetical protein [Clostridiales bacterium]
MRGADTHDKKLNSQGDDTHRKKLNEVVFIASKVNVVDNHGNPLTPTYLKRARQLVKQERASWIAPDTVRMVERHKEDNILESRDGYSMEYVGNGCVPEKLESPLDAGFLESLARRNLEIKRRLIGQSLDFVLLIFFSLFEIALYDNAARMLVALVFLLFWGIRLLVRVIRFVSPSMRNGILAFFRERQEHKLEAEVIRLKALDRELIKRELGR